MCGSAGIFNYRGQGEPVDSDELTRIRDAMYARGPDGAGLWISNNRQVGLAHRRLAIIDLSDGGAQPMATPDEKLRIVFNGEIYNYVALRRELEAKGYNFRSSSDTEVLLYLYAEYGSELVQRLRGMYAFVLWDEAKHGLFLARDPFGIKPLYYSDDGSTFRFSSQVKALKKGGGLHLSPSAAGHAGFFLWGNIPDPFTLYRQIKALPAGSTLWIDRKGAKGPTQFFSIGEEFRRAFLESPLEKRETQQVLRDALEDTVRHHLIADVPVGLFLSAGIDSATLAAFASEQRAGKLYTMTLGFEEYRGTENNEPPLASLVAQRYQTDHATKWVTRQSFAEHLPQLLEAMDQPSIDGVNTYFVAKAASEIGLKVALSGLGGDELFGGYPSFWQIPTAVKRLAWGQKAPFLGRLARHIATPLSGRLVSPKYAGLLEYGGNYGGAYLLRRGLFMPWELHKVLDADFGREGWVELQTLEQLDETVNWLPSNHAKISALEMSWYMRHQLLRDADWASMAHSLEIRVPLVDVQLFRDILRLFAHNHTPSKRDMALSPPNRLPKEVVRRRKTGFSVPVQEWLLTQELRQKRDRGLRGWAKFVYQAFSED